jgi:PAS domain S-box-containing protein
VVADDTLFRELVEQQLDFVVRFTQEGRILYANPAYCEFMGKQKEDLVGSIFMPVTERQYADVIATQMVKLFRPPYSCFVDQWIQTRIGRRCISWSARSIRDEKGAVTSIIATGRDLTKVKKQEKVIKQRDRELLLVLESGERMFFSHNKDHVLDYVSPRIRTLLGFPQRSGKKFWTDYLSDHPLNAAGLERTQRAISSGKREPVYRLEMVKGDGSRIWVEVNEIPVVKDGRTIAIVGSLQDVTEKKQVEEGMEEAEILIKTSRIARENSAPSQTKPSPLGYFRAVFGRKEGDEPEEDSPIPETGSIRQ